MSCVGAALDQGLKLMEWVMLVAPDHTHVAGSAHIAMSAVS